MGENVISTGLTPDSCGCAPRCFSKIRIISESGSALVWLAYILGGICGEGVKGGAKGVSIVDCIRTVWIGREKRGGDRSHISKAPCSHQRRQHRLISFLKYMLPSNKISLSAVLAR